MKITVCIGSSCHLKGSQQIVEQLQQMVNDHAAGDRIELAGAFCMGDCRNGVCVRVEEDVFSLKPENTNEFFQREVLPRMTR